MTQNKRHIDLTAGLPRPKTLVCVTDQRDCDRIIKAGRRLSQLTDSELLVLNIALPNQPQDPQSVEYLFSVSKENDAEMTVLFANDVAKAIIQYIKSNKISFMLTGVPAQGDSITTRIWSKFTHVTFFVVEYDGNLREVARPAIMAAQLSQAVATL